MKTTPSHLKAIIPVLLSVLFAPVSYGDVSQQSTASTAAIAVDRTQYFNQTSASAPAAQPTPFSLNFNIRGSSQNMSTWGPAFYKPGSGGVPQTGSSTATNTGTLNFSATPNNGTNDYMFSHDFATNTDLVAAYPLGAYGVKFQGTGAPTPSTFTAGLEFATSGSTYPTATPQITSVNNGAVWSSGALKLNPSGVTTLTLNTFPEYSSSTYGSVITAGIYNASSGNVVATASVEAYYLPTLGVNQPAVTQLTIDGAWLTPGTTYTLEIQYVIIASAPVEGYLNGENFQGVASYVKNTSISVSLSGTTTVTTGVKADFNADNKSDLVWSNTTNGDRYLWLMNGTSVASSVFLGNVASNWSVVTGDFNADGKADLLWSNTTNGDRYIWLMNGSTVTSSVFLGNVAPAWTVATGDFNADGKTDLLWSNTTNGDRYVWLMNGTAISSSVFLSTVAPVWTVATGDFNADGKTDLVWSNTTNGDRYIWLMNGTTVASSVFLGNVAASWTVTTGDYNSDGKTDLLWSNTANGDRYFWLMNGTAISSSVFLSTVAPQWTVAP